MSQFSSNRLIFPAVAQINDLRYIERHFLCISVVILKAEKNINKQTNRQTDERTVHEHK